MKASYILFTFILCLAVATADFSSLSQAVPTRLRGVSTLATSDIIASIPQEVKSLARIEAHRGAGHLEPENSIPAFQKAVELGIQGVETDVWLTKDKVPVVAHGILGGLVIFAKLNKRLDQINAEELKSEQYILDNGQMIPTLAEVLDICKDKVQMNIEIKDKNPEVVERTLEVVKEKGMIDQVSFSSFNHIMRGKLTEALEHLNITTPVSFGYLIGSLGGKFPDYKTTLPGDSINVDVALLSYNRKACLDAFQKAAENDVKLKFWFPIEFDDEVPFYDDLLSLNADTIITNKPLSMLEYYAK